MVRTIPSNTNIDTYVRSGGIYDGAWVSLADAVTANITGLPEGETSLFHLDVYPGTGHQIIQFYTGGIYRRGINSVSGGTFGEWARLDQPAAVVATGSEAEERAVRLDQARQRSGGRIGTGGLPVLTLRFDDWADDMETKVMPRLRARKLPASWAATVAYVENPTQGIPQTWATVAGWVRDGVELAGHSWSHTNANTPEGIRKEVIESADYFETKVPAAAVDTWFMPGLSSASASYDGFGGGDIVENYYNTIAGKMITQRYPVTCGYVPGRFKPLVGSHSIGQTHVTIDNDTAASAIAKIQSAMDAQSGITIMVHPFHLDGMGKLSLASLDAILDWIVLQRDAGKLLVLTARGQAFADASTSHRLNLFKNADFKNGLAGWEATTGYNTGTDGARAYATTSTGAPLKQTFDMLSFGYLRGGVVELSALVRAVGSDAEVRTAITGTASIHAVAVAEGWRWVRHITTIGKDLPITAALTGFVGRFSGGEVQVAESGIRPI